MDTMLYKIYLKHCWSKHLEYYLNRLQYSLTWGVNNVRNAAQHIWLSLQPTPHLIVIEKYENDFQSEIPKPKKQAI